MRDSNLSRCSCAALLAMATLLPACSSSSESSRRTAPVIPVQSQSIVVDGDIGEWPPSVVMTSDEWWVYLRWKVAGPSQTLQSSDENLALWLDLDTNPATGARPDAGRGANQLGIDLEIDFSPIGDDGIGRGVRVTGHGADGSFELGHEQVGFHFAPTYASEWYEGRVSRAALTNAGLPSPEAGALVTGMLVLRDATGRTIGQSEPFETEAVPSVGEEPRADLRLPPQPRNGLRVVSWNVLRAQPMENPGPFARVLSVLDPDVVLLQEWTTTPNEIEAWFNASVPLGEGVDGEEPGWFVRTNEAWGVAVVSRYPLEPFGHEDLYIDGAEYPVRFVGALIDSPVGYLAAASVHLKCCGSADSEEDQTRILEAGAINRSLAEAFGIEPVDLRIVGGDINLVGSRPPLDVLRNGLDADGSDLEIADARILGDAAYYTWRVDGNTFSPGRLDFAVYSDSTVRQARCFVLDSRMLSDAALDVAGLDFADTDASDHLPLVVDLMPMQ